MPHHGASVYRKVQAESSSRPRLLLELFRRLAADLRAARACIEARDVGGKARALDHALAILGQLEEGLDHDRAPELCRNLAGCYASCRQRLLRAGRRLETAPLDEAVRLLAPIHEAFEEVIERRPQER
jgi:flagellar protein FliS